MVPVSLIFLFLIRPVTGFIGMIDQRISIRKKILISFFGIMGIGSIYYLMFALHHADFERSGEVLALVTLVIVLSVLIHGILAKPSMKWIEDYRDPEPNDRDARRHLDGRKRPTSK